MKIKKSDLLSMIQEQNNVIDRLIHQVNCHHKDIVRLESIIEPEPQLKQLGQSVFDGLDEKWRFAAVDSDGAVAVYLEKPVCNHCQWYVEDRSLGLAYKYLRYMKGCNTPNWRNSLIERDDIAKELAEVDLSSELTGSDLARAMLARGDRWVVCMVANNINNVMLATRPLLVFRYVGSIFETLSGNYAYAVPVNNQGEPLTASEVGL